MVRYQLDPVAIFVSGPVQLFEKYRVTLPGGGLMPLVTVVGPEEQIKLLETRQFTPIATLELAKEDVGQALPKAPKWTLPRDVTVSDEDKNRTVDYEIKPR
jgi:hypothetical protein